MRRTSHRRPPEAAVTFTKDTTHPDPVPEVAAPAQTTAESPVKVGWGWRLALFLWGASFVFLFLYEILMSLFPGSAK